MKIVISIVCVVLATSVIIAREASQKANSGSLGNATSRIATNRYLSKGGVGIVNKSLYLVVKSATNDTNELIVKPTPETERRWNGKLIAKAEVVLFYKGQVWSMENLPNSFELNKSIVISFESDKVRFFDFQEMEGGYYDRIKVDE